MHRTSPRRNGALTLLVLIATLAGCEGSAGVMDGGSPPVDMGPPSLDASPDRSDAGAAHDAASSCAIDAPTSCPDASPRYADLVPIFQTRCATCHDGTPGGPWPLDTYGHIADWQNEIRSELLRCSMPPLDAGVPFSADERLAILVWLRCGLPM